MNTATFTIDGMNCDACASTIKSLVEKEPGVRMVSVSFKERQARVLYEPEVIGEERLIEPFRGRASALWVARPRVKTLFDDKSRVVGAARHRATRRGRNGDGPVSNC